MSRPMAGDQFDGMLVFVYSRRNAMVGSDSMGPEEKNDFRIITVVRRWWRVSPRHAASTDLHFLALVLTCVGAPSALMLQDA